MLLGHLTYKILLNYLKAVYCTVETEKIIKSIINISLYIFFLTGLYTLQFYITIIIWRVFPYSFTSRFSFFSKHILHFLCTLFFPSDGGIFSRKCFPLSSHDSWFPPVSLCLAKVLVHIYQYTIHKGHKKCVESQFPPPFYWLVLKCTIQHTLIIEVSSHFIFIIIYFIGRFYSLASTFIKMCYHRGTVSCKKHINLSLIPSP